MTKEYPVSFKGKPIVTPAGNPLVVPSAKLADAITAEWNSLAPKAPKSALKFTPIACVAIDIVTGNREKMLADIIPYIDTDLVSYRAGDIPELSIQQSAALDPLLLWIKGHCGISLITTDGLMPVAQDADNQQKLDAVLAGFDAWKLAAFAVAVKPLGSVVLALALVEGRLTTEAAFNLAHLEENYETLKWGVDDEKEQAMRAKRNDVDAVGQFLAALI